MRDLSFLESVMLIDVDLGDGRIFPMEKHLLDGPYLRQVDNAHERTIVTEYRFRGKTVHKSAHVQLKDGIGIESIFGSIG
jgi:hypothetical protein